VSKLYAKIDFIEFYHPQKKLTNFDLAQEYPNWSVEKITEKTGITNRYIASDVETVSELATQAALKLFVNSNITKEEIDYLIICTQSPDYKLPTTACIVQEMLGLKNSIGAIDINQGCSGYVYGLGLCKGLIETGQAKKVLLITAETYSKYIHSGDRSVRTLFGDAASATIIGTSDKECLGPFVYGTDGKGYKNLIVPHGGSKYPISSDSHAVVEDNNGNLRSEANLYMNGPEVFIFTLSNVKKELKKLLKNSGLSIDDIDHFVFHQPNKFMLDKIRQLCKIPEEKFHRSYEEYGNTVSSTIPIGLKILSSQNRLIKGDKVVVIGFGVGYSSAATLIIWQ
jgi:3-oxoacyl-[acyl-carrier-protein] synthase-3